jgi:hypothetical protein
MLVQFPYAKRLLMLARSPKYQIFVAGIERNAALPQYPAGFLKPFYVSMRNCLSAKLKRIGYVD